MIFFLKKSKNFKEKLEDKLGNIDSAMDLWIYHNYFRFLLTVHDMTVTDLEKLDTISSS